MAESLRPVPVPLVSLPARLAVFLSGRGSNFVALADACASGELPAEIVLVVSDQADAVGLQVARGRGIPCVVRNPEIQKTRSAWESLVVEELERGRVDLVCLAGYMRILSAAFLDRYPLRVVNIHPSLLPSFPGLHAQAQALRYGVRFSGATVHFVDAGVDSGAIISQQTVPVLDDDTPESLHARIHAAEHELYPKCVAAIARGGIAVQGRRVVWRKS